MTQLLQKSNTLTQYDNVFKEQF